MTLPHLKLLKVNFIETVFQCSKETVGKESAPLEPVEKLVYHQNLPPVIQVV